MKDSQVSPIVALPDPMVTGMVEAMMAHPLPNGAVDYERVARAFIVVLTECMSPQPAEICQRMQDDFSRALRDSIRAARMPKVQVIDGGKP